MKATDLMIGDYNRIKQEVVDKACEWLTNYFVKYLQFDEQIVKDFRKAMEE